MLTVCIFLYLFSSYYFETKIQKRKNKNDIQLQGKWKVTEFLTRESYLEPSYSYYEPFLGRSINIMPDQIIESIEYWPGNVEYFYLPYDEVMIEDIDAIEYGGKDHMLEP